MNEEMIMEILGHFTQARPNLRDAWPESWTATTKELFCQMVKAANDAGLDCYFTGVHDELFRIGIRDTNDARADKVFARIYPRPRDRGLQVAQGDNQAPYILNDATHKQLEDFLKQHHNQDGRQGYWPDQYNTSSEGSMNKEEQTGVGQFPLNLILYGPPGTGKTYSVVMKAMSIIDKKVYENVSDEIYKTLKAEFDKRKKSGQIDFITFHQSYGYEDFVEGIRPITQESGQPTYEVMAGILRRIAKKATDNFKSGTPEFREEFNEEQLFDTAYQLLEEEISNSPEAKIEANLFRGGVKCALWVRDQGKSFSVQAIDGKQSYPISRKTMFRAWQLRNEIKSPGDIDKTNGTYIWAILKLLVEKSENLNNAPINQETTQPYILIIDEINRGNISKIFGELITLIENDKRLGEGNELRVKLPYSPDEEFGLPPNLYIIGTMNTADRSIALLDTALRRRFEFEEKMPKPELLSNNVGGVDLQKMLKAINERIELLFDRDHTIGHAYFMDVKNLEDLKRVFRHKIIPLLQEYFYEDWKKIMLVLYNNGFVIQEENKPKLPQLRGDSNNYDEREIYRIVEDEAFTVDKFKIIYPDTVTNQA